MSGELVRRGAITVHSSAKDCPRVRSGEWPQCLGHAPQPVVKKKRRRINLALRLEEARSALQAVGDAIDWARELGLGQEGERDAAYIGRLQKVAAKLRQGIEYVTEVNPTRRKI